jgi:hypothetical protein
MTHKTPNKSTIAVSLPPNMPSYLKAFPTSSLPSLSATQSKEAQSHEMVTFWIHFNLNPRESSSKYSPWPILWQVITRMSLAPLTSPFRAMHSQTK